MKLKDKLIQYFDAGYPIIYINSYEEIKTDIIIRHAAGGREILEWNNASMFCEFESKRTYMERTLEQTLDFLQKDNELNRRMLVLKDAVQQFENPRVIALLKDIALQIQSGLDSCIVIVSSILKIPKELEKFITIMKTDALDEEEIRVIITEFAEREQLMLSGTLLEKMSIAFKGLTEFEIENLLASAVAEDGELTSDSLKLIFEQKKQMIMKSGILEMIDVQEKPDDIGGLENMKAWLSKKASVYKNINRAKAFGVDMPKGVLIAGVPGCGKSLTAKVTSSLFEVPLMKLDMGRILGKYVGESEENMRKAIRLAESISPCILWIDELEKAFAGVQGSGNEVTMRLFGTFLTWLQEKTAPVFVVATANDITSLPAEFLRKGRFDDIFYVGLPNEAERRKIFEIHIGKRRSKNLPDIDVSELVNKSDGYSGADIEGVVRDAIETVFAEGKLALSTADVVSAIKNTKSLSVLMEEYLEKLNNFYNQNNFKNASVK